MTLPVPLTTGRPKMGGRKPNKHQRLALCADQPAMSTKAFSESEAWTRDAPADLAAIARWIQSQRDGRDRFRWVLRDSLDELLDGQRTGRWAYNQLGKTEKTHLGSIVEIKLSREFDIPEGETIDWKIGSDEVDCKFSRDFGAWQIPIEMYLPVGSSAADVRRAGTANHAALLVWMNDDGEQWAAGLIRVERSILTGGFGNRDGKRAIAAEHRRRIHWLWQGRQDDLPPNLFLRMTAEQRESIFSEGSGQRRVNQLLRIFEGSLVPRAVVATAAIQDDPMKRARDARLARNLGREGFLVLGHQDADPHIARALGLPIPTKGEFVPCRVVEASDSDDQSVRIEGRRWRLADATDAIGAAPQVPKRKPSEGWAVALA
jgi:hypothetical protein